MKKRLIGMGDQFHLIPKNAGIKLGNIYKISPDGLFRDALGNNWKADDFLWQDCLQTKEVAKKAPVEKVISPKQSLVTEISKLQAQLSKLDTNKLSRKEVLEKVKCFQVQSGGSHYTDMELGPLEATYLRYGLEGLKAAIHTKVDKYISRKKDDAVGQLKKAEHCLQVLIEVTEAENNGRSN
jgi:prefoldin subunit 5